MVERDRLLALSFYEKSPFTGSDKAMRYRIEKQESEDGKKLLVYAWFGLYAFDHTPREEMKTHLADFSEDGLDEITDWLNHKNQTA